MIILGLLLLSSAVTAAQWQVKSEVDAFTDQETVKAIVAGAESQAVMQAFCSKGDIFVVFTTGVALSSGAARRADFMIRVDDRPAVELSGAGIGSHLTLTRSTHGNFPTLWAEMRATKARLMVRIVSPTGRLVEDSFTGENMQAALEEVAAACASPI
jgi:hypothetical protein